MFYCQTGERRERKMRQRISGARFGRKIMKLQQKSATNNSFPDECLKLADRRMQRERQQKNARQKGGRREMCSEEQ